MKKPSYLLAIFGSLVAVQFSSGAIILNEVLASTTGPDTEFIELYNSGLTSIDISGWQIFEIESDPGTSYGNIDDTFTIPGSADDGTVILGASDFYLIGNDEFETIFGITPDLNLPLTIENSSSTLILKNAAGETQYSAYLVDSDGGGANDEGTPITPDISVGPDGSFLPAGYALETDGGSTARILEFSPRPAPSATPGASNIPEPATSLLGGLALLGLILRRR